MSKKEILAIIAKYKSIKPEPRAVIYRSGHKPKKRFPLYSLISKVEVK